jgi:ABC-type transport system substrate-binding protein
MLDMVFINGGLMVSKGLLFKLVLPIVALCLMVPLFTSGCSKTTTSTPAPTSTPVQTATTSQIPRGGTLRVGASDEAQNLGYPAISVKDVDYRHVAPCLEALGYYDKAGNVVPWLATGWKEDPAAKTITVTLKKGIKFHDGTDFNAEAVKWNFQQFIDAKRNEVAGLTSMDVIDDSTIRLNFSAWNNSFIYSFPFISQMISPTAFQKNGKDWAINNPVGTGPFKIASWQRDVKVRYEKFDGYWQKGKPYLDAMEFVQIADPTVRLASFQKREIDVIEGIQESPTDLLSLKTSGKYTVQTLIPLGSGPIGLGGDSGNAKSPFADVRVRQAVSYAIDKKSIVDNVLHGLGTTSTQFGQPGYWGYNDAVKGLDYNPDKAKALLSEAGYPTGFKTTLLVQGQLDWVVAAQSNLKAAGIDATIDVAGERFPDAILHTGWTGLCLFILKGGADITPYIGNTFSKNGFIWANSTLHNDELEQMCKDVQSAADFATKQKAMQNAMYLIFDKYVILTPVYEQVVACAKYPDVHDDGLYTVDDFQWTPADVWIGK